MSKPTEDSIKRWNLVALCIGYNELIKKMTIFGDKFWCAMVRGQAEDELRELGGDAIYSTDGRVEFTMIDPPIRILVGEDMIESMRTAVAEWDSKAVKK